MWEWSMTAKPKDGTEEQADQTSRRDMLKRTAAATATMGVVGTAATGNAAAVGIPDNDCDVIECGPDEKKVREETWWPGRYDCHCEPVETEDDDDGGGGDDGGFLFY
jgi:hypothetical protein